MATKICSYFFKKEHNTHTVESLRSLGFAAKDTGTGFIEAFPYTAIIIAQKVLSLKGKRKEPNIPAIKDTQRDRLVEALQNGKTEGAPDVMQFINMQDDQISLVVYPDNKPPQKLTTYFFRNVEDNVDVRDYMGELYDLQYADDEINFSRFTEYDLVSDSQRAEEELLTKELEDYDYNQWLSAYNQLDETDKLLTVCAAAAKLRGCPTDFEHLLNDEIPNHHIIYNVERYAKEKREVESNGK